MRILFTKVRLVDEAADAAASVVVENGRIAEVRLEDDHVAAAGCGDADIRIDGGGLVLMPAFVDLHVHLRDPGFPLKETLESGCLAAAAGGYGTLVCMANTAPVLDNPAAAAALRRRSATLGLVDLYPVLSLSRGMDGVDTSHLEALSGETCAAAGVRMLSEDGKDIADPAVFRRAFTQAARLGLPVSCHCDAGGPEAAASKERGEPRSVYSRLEENIATERALAVGRETGARTHIAHVSTREAADLVRSEKAGGAAPAAGFRPTCEATPHHLALTEADADALGAESFGRVNPPLRTEEDRRALLDAVADGTVDAIATDHAPHTEADKAAGAPGFTGLETAFSVCHGLLVRSGRIDLRRLSALMSAAPARILGLTDRGRIAVGLRADLVLVDTAARRTVTAGSLLSKGKNSPFAGRTLEGRVVMTIHDGRIVYDGRNEEMNR